MRLFNLILLFPVAAVAQQMVSMATVGDNTIITIRIKPAAFTTFSGAPYAARRVNVQTSIRTNGTVVPQNRIANFYRDSAGRNRTEQQVVPRDSPYMTTIMDPILGCEYVLDPGNKIAHRLVGVEVRTRPVPAATDTGAGVEFMPATTPASGVSVNSEDLGTRTIQGLEARGTKVTTTWPPGTRQGNEQTLTAVTETWVNASLGGLLVEEHRTQPGQPDYSYSLENVAIGEPAATLFAPPPDYRIVDESSDFKISVPRKATAPVKLTNHGVTAATIPNAPFSGTRRVSSIQTLSDGTQVARPAQTTFSAWRDSQGRVRTEWPPQGIVPGGVEIKDPTTGYIYNLDYANHIAYRTALVNAPPAVHAADAGASVEVAQLGTQVISGVAASGVRTTTTLAGGTGKPDVTEIWTAQNEGVVLLVKDTTPTGDDATIEMKNFTTREPDPDLFRVPATYQIFDEFGNLIQTKQ